MVVVAVPVDALLLVGAVVVTVAVATAVTAAFVVDVGVTVAAGHWCRQLLILGM